MSDPIHVEPVRPTAEAEGLSPPTDAQVLEDVQFGDPAVWPKIVGIISIVWASLGLLGGICGVVALVALPAFIAKQPGFDPANMPPSMVFGPLKLVLIVAGIGLSVLLMFAGIATVTRRDVGRQAHLAYAATGLMFLVLQVYSQLTDISEMKVWIANNPANPVAKGGTGGMYFGLVFAVVLGVIWPGFLLIWFGLVKTRLGVMKELK